MSDITHFNSARRGEVFSWAEVSGVHKIRSGIYQKKGQLISLLTDFGRINPCYPDFHGTTADTIFYTGSGRRGDQKLDPGNRALLNAIETEIQVPLFNKLSVGRWEFLGYFRVLDGKYVFEENEERMIWRFRLEKFEN